MKFTLILFCLAVFAAEVVYSFDKDVFMKVGQKCKEETKTSDEEVKKIMEKEAPTTYEAKCMMACIFKEMGMLTKDGKYDLEGNQKAVKAAFGDDEEKLKMAKKFSDLCKEKVEAAPDKGDGCERAAAMFACAMEKGKDLGYDKQA